MTVSCKLASKPLFSDSSAAKLTVEAVLDLGSQRSDFFLDYRRTRAAMLTYLGISLWRRGGFSDRKWAWSLAKFSGVLKSGTPLLQILHPPLLLKLLMTPLGYVIVLLHLLI